MGWVWGNVNRGRLQKLDEASDVTTCDPTRLIHELEEKEAWFSLSNGVRWG